MGRPSDSTSSTSDAGKAGARRRQPERSAAQPEAGLEVARVVGAHGLRGQLRIHCFGADPEALLGITRLRLAAPEAGGRVQVFEVRSIAPGRRGELRVALAGVAGRDAAEALRGHRVRVDPAELPELPEGEVYGYELVGCRLEDEDGKPVGTVREIWSTGAPDVLVVDGADGREHLVPAALLRQLDVAGRRGVVEVLPGLLEGSEGAEGPEASDGPDRPDRD